MVEENKIAEKEEGRVHNKEKIIWILIDGIGDNTNEELNKTPLQSAKTPNLNLLSKSGINGLHDPFQTGLTCGTDTAHMSMFGYTPMELYNGRGAFETMGAGIKMDLNCVAFKCNFAYMDMESRIVVKRRVDRYFEDWGLPLCEYLDDIRIPGFQDHRVMVKHATEHRCAIRVTGPRLNSSVTGTDPLVEGKPLCTTVATVANCPDADYLAALINTLSEAITAKLLVHPINIKRKAEGKCYTNIILLRGCGSRLNVPTFEEKHNFTPFLIAPTCVVAGIGETFGFDVKKAPGATGYYNTNLSSKGKTCLKYILGKESKYDFAFVHIKAVDDAGHDGSLEKKIEFIEKSDEMLGEVCEGIVNAQEDSIYILVVTGDHSTPIKLKDHSFEPVPFVISTVDAYQYEKNLQIIEDRKGLLRLKDQVQEYNEIEAAEGALGRFQGSQIMNIIKNFAKSVNKIMD